MRSTATTISSSGALEPVSPEEDNDMKEDIDPESQKEPDADSIEMSALVNYLIENGNDDCWANFGANTGTLGCALMFIMIVIDIYATIDGFEPLKDRTNMILALVAQLLLIAGGVIGMAGICCRTNAESHNTVDRLDERELPLLRERARKFGVEMPDNKKISDILRELWLFKSRSRQGYQVIDDTKPAPTV